MPLINCKINLIFTLSANCVIIYIDVAYQGPIFARTETKLHVPVVTLSKLGFKRIIDWNKYLSKPELLAQKPNINHLAKPSLQEVNWRSVLIFENVSQRASNRRYYLPNVEIKDCNVMIAEKKMIKNVINQNKKSNKSTNKN